jgi:succinoglycan biosynthesis transport protein ExoP
MSLHREHGARYRDQAQQYADLYKKASELETERRVMLGSTRLVSLAELPNKPFFPKKTPFLAAGGTLALILGIAAALLADQLYPPPQNGAVATPQAARRDVAATPAKTAASLPVLRKIRAIAAASSEHKPRRAAPFEAGAPILARLPRLRRLQPVSLVGAIMQEHVPLTVAQTLDLAEGHGGFRAALTELMQGLRIGEGEPGRRIVVTSSAPGEGRTLTTLALAHHAAARGCRVLAIECDLQRPDFARALSLSGKPGLLSVLAGDISVRDAVTRTENPKLDVLMAGGASAKAADRLGRKNLAQLFSVFRSYDVVVIDSPLPSQRHARYLAGVDSVLLCMKGDDALTERLAAVVTAVKALGGSNIAIAATMAELERGTARQPRPVPTEVYARAV